MSWLSMRWLRSVTLGVLLAFIAAACDGGAPTTTAAATTGAATTTAPKRETLKIGAIMDLSGPTASTNKFMQEAIQLAIDEVNAKGGINGHQLEIIFGDDAGKAPQSVSLAVKYIEQDNVVAILGPMLSGPVLAVVEQMQKSNKFVPMIGSGGDLSLLHGEYKTREWYFAATLDVQDFGAQMVDVLKQSGATKFGSMFTAVISAENSMKISRARVQELGLEWVGEEAIDATQTDVFANAKKLKDAGVDGLINWLIPNPATQTGWLRAKEQLTWNVNWATSDISLSSQYESLPELVEGAYIGGICDPRNPRFQAMLSSYEKKYGRKATVAAYDSLGLIYNGAQVLFDAIARAPEPVTPQAIRDNIESLSGFKSHCETGDGTTSLSKDNHGLLKKYPFFQLVKGERKYLTL